METYFDSFHESEHISDSTFLPLTDEVINDQLYILESLKQDEKAEDGQGDQTKNQYSIEKEDFHQIMSDWQQHVGLLQAIDTDDLGFGLGLGLDCGAGGGSGGGGSSSSSSGGRDTLNPYQSNGLVDDKDISILSKALKSTIQKSFVTNEPTPKLLTASESKKELIIGNVNANCSSQFESSQKLCELIKTETSLVGKVTLLNGEKEILGKNIVGLHCLNEIKENPDENCQVTSTVINGKRYKIIIKPKSLRVKKLSEEKIKKSLIKKILQCNLASKSEPKEDEIISEMRNGNYDVPILGSDVLPSWDLVNFESGWDSPLGGGGDAVAEAAAAAAAAAAGDAESTGDAPESPKKPVKLKKRKKRTPSARSDEEVDVETVSEKAAVVEGSNLNNLLENFEEEMAKLQDEEGVSVGVGGSRRTSGGSPNLKTTSEKIKNSLPAEMIEKIEALKRKKDCRIPLIQAMPTKKSGKCCTRMQDAVATMNRNKLLKIVSNGDTISLDHDYCSVFAKGSSSKGSKKSSYLAEKNPKKDSGMESGDVSDTSEGPNTPEAAQTIQSNVSNRLVVDGQQLQHQQRRHHSHQQQQQKEEKQQPQGNGSDQNKSVKPLTNSHRRSSNVTSNLKAKGKEGSDPVKTETVSNGNKALTNNRNKTNSDVSDNSSSSSNNNGTSSDGSSSTSSSHNSSGSSSSVTVPSDTCNRKSCEGDDRVTEPGNEKSAEVSTKGENDGESSKPDTPAEPVRPKRKLKLEEYLSRRNTIDKEKRVDNKVVNENPVPESGSVTGESSQVGDSRCGDVETSKPSQTTTTSSEKVEGGSGGSVGAGDESGGSGSGSRSDRRNNNLPEKKDKFWDERSRRSSSVSSGGGRRDYRKGSRSRSRSRWRSSSNSSNANRREGRSKYRSRWSVSRDRRLDYSSGSSSRSPSRDSSISSDYDSHKRTKHFSRYRRSRSRSSSRGRSRSRNRSYSHRRRPNSYYYSRYSNRRRSRSPFYAYSVREKQRQIEERRVIYVGRIEEGMTNAKLRKRFSIFGPIIDISLHFREYGDNYGFVTYAYKADAYDAVEHGNDDPSLPRYDLCFGGRRGFCKEKYADLDGMPTSYSGFNDAPSFRSSNDSFDLLLKEAQAKLKSRKKQ